MNKYYLIHKKSGEIKAICNSEIGYDESIFDLRKIKTTKLEDDFINENYKLKYKDKLEIEEPEHIKEENKKKDLKDKLSKATTVKELKEIIINNI